VGNPTEDELDDLLHQEWKVPLFDNRGRTIGKTSVGWKELEELHRVVALPFAP
jgi:hypothetical protein